MPVFELQDIDPDGDFPALARCTIDAYESPPQNFLHILFPIHDSAADGNTDNHHEAREAAIAEAGDRLRDWHTHEPTSHWLKVVDVETGRVAGGASWNIFQTNPFANPFGHELEVTWFPNDASATRFVEKALENYAMPRFEVAQRPHLYLLDVFTHPDFRRQGVAQMMLDWGIQKADELGLEIFLEAKPPSKPLFEKQGFVVINENNITPVADSPDDVKRWQEMEEKASPLDFWLMWRPVGGNYEEGKTVKPWEEDGSVAAA